MAEEQQHETMQLAFRSEGQFINAYIEKRGEKPFVFLLGSLNERVANPLMRKTWEKLITMALDQFVESLSGEPLQITSTRIEPVGGSA